DVLRRSGTTVGFGNVQTAGLNNDAVTYAKMQNVSAASRLLGRGSAAGSGDVEEIALGTGLGMSTTTLNVSTRSIMQFWSTTAVIVGSTYYLGRGDSLAEQDVVFSCPVSGSIVALYTNANQFAGASDSWTYTLRVNLADTALTHAVTGAGTATGSSSGSVAVTAGQVVCVKIVTTGAAGVAQHMCSIAIAN
ncbi:MAG: hypothetical protein AAB368_13460, partial [bacterium]